MGLYFDISYREMQVPIEFMDFLNNEIFKPYFRNNSCVWHCFVKMAVYGCNIDKICHIQQTTNKI